MINKQKLADWLRTHAHRLSTGRCAMYVRLGLEAAGLDASGHPADAKDYGPFLVSKGAEAVALEGYEPQVADIAVFAGNEFHPYGHVCVWCGPADGKPTAWISDFVQRRMSPYSEHSPEALVYRFPD